MVVNISTQTPWVPHFSSTIVRERNRFRVNLVSAVPSTASSRLNIRHYIIEHDLLPNLSDSQQKQNKKQAELEEEEEEERLTEMGINQQQIDQVRKPRFLCLHGFRTSGEILKKQVVGKWPESVVNKIDLVFVDAPFPAEGKSDVEGIFDPPYYEWFQFDKEFTEYRNFDECLAYIEDCMLNQGPFDGLLGFSQGAILSAALPGLQAKGVALTKVPKIKFLIIIGGAKFRSPTITDNAYSSRIECPSVHFLGETDFLKKHGTTLLEDFVDPVVIHHPRGHTIPRFDEKGLEMMHNFLEKIQLMITLSSSHGQEVEEKEGEENQQEIHI
ncbi:Serine hydrolase FSH [Macleaya cordata]|uniref:Serine hydrolase FSH n=1 Tax=Macleaya cordata TaxID=56857 RepID=A0A200QXR3_MACCD|nr:Serine hydrolase FSH [Macleaya cordata]